MFHGHNDHQSKELHVEQTSHRSYFVLLNCITNKRRVAVVNSHSFTNGSYTNITEIWMNVTKIDQFSRY